MTFPESSTPIRTPLPQVFLHMAGVSVETRFIGCYYQCNPTWTDGRSLRQFNYFLCWEPLKRHPAIAFPLGVATRDTPYGEDGTYPGFGSDDSQPTHLLLIDQQEMTMAIAPAKDAHRFLEAQHPPEQPISAAEYEALKEEALEMMRSLQADMSQNPTRFGMHELYSQPDAELMQLSAEMHEFLNDNLDPEIKEVLRTIDPQMREISDLFGL